MPDRPLDEILMNLEELVLEALMQLPVVRGILSIASPEWRGLWALTWLVGLTYLAARIYESVQRSALHRRMVAMASARPPAAPGAATPEVGTSAPGSDANNARRAPAFADAVAAAPEPPPVRVREPLPVADGRRSAATRISLVAALVGVLLLAASRAVRDHGPAPSPADGGPELFDGAPPLGAAPPFTFAARGWRQAGTACVATLEVTGGSAAPRTLAVYVMDSSGTVLGRDVLRVPSLTVGAFHDFRFAGVTCDAISEWQVQGQR